MKVVVTGGCGQVGSHIVEMLLERGDSVVALDNLETGRLVHLPKHERLEFVNGSIADSSIVNQVVSASKPDVMVHAAASYKDPLDWRSDVETNALGGVNLIKACVENNVGRFVYYQTALCYGLHAGSAPIHLDQVKDQANSSYAISKTVVEDYLTISGLDYVTFRLANVIGPRNLSGPLPIFYQRLSEGRRCFVTEARRDFVFVKDLARVSMMAIDGVGKGAYHFSSGSDVPILDLYNSVVKALGINKYPEPERRELTEDDAPSILLDASRTFEDFGNIELAGLDEIVASAIEYYREFGTNGEITHLKQVSGEW